MLKKVSLGIALFWTGIILYLCLIRSSELPAIDVTNIDKFVHAFFHFVYTVLWFYALRFCFRNISHVKILGIVFLMSLTFGIAIELFQAFFTTTRNGDVIDVLANSSGTLLAIVVIQFLDKNDFLSKIAK